MAGRDPALPSRTASGAIAKAFTEAGYANVTEATVIKLVKDYRSKIQELGPGRTPERQA